MNTASVPSEQEALRLAETYAGEWTIIGREERIEDESPPLPYTTADLLEEAALRLGWSAEQTMEVAQALFEQGLITYPRTDSSRVAPEASQGARQVVIERYSLEAWGNISLSTGSGQDGHEAIRPSDPRRAPDGLSASPQEQLLYRLIWARFLAAHMRPARVRVIRLILEK